MHVIATRQDSKTQIFGYI